MVVLGGVLNTYTRKTDFELATLQAAVADGSLEKYGLKPGDQKTINGYTYVIAGLNPMKGANDYRVSRNHVGLIVIAHTAQSWNTSGKTYEGADNRGAGYKNSDLHYYLKNTVLPHVQADLGSENLIQHKKWLSSNIDQNGYNRKGVSSGCASAAAWSDEFISALSEVQVYGSTVWSSSAFDTGEACMQLDVFRNYSFTEIFGETEHPWLRDVVSTTDAAYASNQGRAHADPAERGYQVAALVLFN